MTPHSNIPQDQYSKTAGILVLFFLIGHCVLAHDGDSLAKLDKTEVALVYLQLGFMHIIPLGPDHILFVLSLFLLNPRLKPILWQATAFTVAHTITLGLAMYAVIKPPAYIVEPLIALSILYVALENIFSPRLKASRIGVVFLFGLVHGMGFAGALTGLGLASNTYFGSLIMFNLGVELGQFAVILAAFLVLGLPFGKKTYYRQKIVVPLSAIIAAIALYWAYQRIFLA